MQIYRNKLGHAEARTELRAQAAASDRQMAMAGTTFDSGDHDLRIPAILELPLTWWERACFRSKLRADIRDRSDFLRDIGIDVLEAHAEVCRFFWQPITLKRP